MIDPVSLLEEGTEPAGDVGDSVREMSRETFWAFVVALVLAQAGLFAASLGAMLAGFRGQWALGGALAVGGVLALALTVAVYRWHEAVT